MYDHAVYMREWNAAHPESVRATQRKCYERNKPTVLARMAVRHARHKERLLVAKAAGCVRCGSMDELHLHHVDPSTKRTKVSNMATYSDRTFWEEVAKCVVLCRPCHQAEHGGAA
jgi:hypothetical protein